MPFQYYGENCNFVTYGGLGAYHKLDETIDKINLKSFYDQDLEQKHMDHLQDD